MWGIMANIQIRLDDTLKAQAQQITANLGMDVATAVRIFLTQMVREKALPFTPSMATQKSNENTQSYEEWLRKAVHTGLQALERGDFASRESIENIFIKAGVDVH